MKKNWKWNFYKRQNKRKAYKLFLRGLATKAKRKKRRIKLIGLKKSEKKIRVRHDIKHKDFVHVVAPANLSFVDNTVEVIKFINKLKLQYDHRKKVYVVLKKVTNLTFDALVVLLSIMVKFKSNNIGFNGDLPADMVASNILRRSGFLELLYQIYKPEDTYYLNRGSALFTHAALDVDPVLGQQIVSRASKAIWKDERRCQGVQRAFLELMQNTNNHADIGKEGEKHWWLSVYHIPKENKVTFAFIDFGVGIFTSLDNKTAQSKFHNWLEKMGKIFSWKNNAELLKLILDGELHKTATGKYYRGKGLPGLNQLMQRNQISNLHVITNNVKANVNDNDYQVLSSNFGGTFIYWELNKNNVNCSGFNQNQGG